MNVLLVDGAILNHNEVLNNHRINNLNCSRVAIVSSSHSLVPLSNAMTFTVGSCHHLYMYYPTPLNGSSATFALTTFTVCSDYHIVKQGIELVIYSINLRS